MKKIICTLLIALVTLVSAAVPALADQTGTVINCANRYNVSGDVNFTTGSPFSVPEGGTVTIIGSGYSSKGILIYKIQYQGMTGWISSNYLRVNAQTPSIDMSKPDAPALRVSPGTDKTVTTTFSFSQVAHAQSYDVEIYNSSSVMIQKLWSTYSGAGYQLQPGIYRARVAGVNNNSGLYTFSADVSFTVTSTASTVPPVTGINAKLAQLQTAYRQGTAWPNSSAIYSSYGECVDFAQMIYTSLFGHPTTSVSTRHYASEINSLSPGDFVKVRWTTQLDHSFIVTNVVGGTVYMVDCNAQRNGVRNEIDWIGTISLSALQSKMSQTLITAAEGGSQGYFKHGN